MSKSKRSHRRSEDKVDESDDQHAIQSDASIEQKKSKKKSSKKSKKHRLKRKATPSESDSDSSSSSSSESSSSSSEEETVKRKKQKKHKKNKRRNKHESVEKVSKSSRAGHSDDEEDVKVLSEPARVHYVSSGEEERHRKALKRTDDKRRPHETAGNERMEYKSKWDSPNDDFDRKRPRDVQQSDRRIEDRGRFEQRRTIPERERDNNRDNYRERGNRQFSPQRERQDRMRNDRRPNESNYRERMDGPRHGGNLDWRPRDRERDYKRPDNNSDRFRRPEPAGRRNNSPRSNSRFGDEKRNDRFGDDKRIDDRRRPNFDRNSQPNDRNRPFRRENETRDVTRMQSNERDRRPSPFKRDHVRSPPVRERSPPPVHDRSPVRDQNPFRRNNSLNRPSDFRHEAERPDRNDSPEPIRSKRKKFSTRDSDGENHEWGKPEDKVKKESDEPPAEKEKPNFGLSGKLTEDTNTVNGVVVKYAEPPEARRPKRRWRLYPFKGEEALQTLHIHRQSCYLIGRDKKVCELAVDHPSCSKQHAALQYRLVPYERKDGSTGKRVKPYIIDLGSANGTFLNNKPIEPKKYYELFEKDMLKFGFSSREYVLLAEDSDVRDGEQIDEEYEPIKEEK